MWGMGMRTEKPERACRGLKNPKPKPLSRYVPLVVCFQNNDQAVAVLPGAEQLLFTSDSILKSSSSVHKVAELFVGCFFCVRVFVLVSLVETVHVFNLYVVVE